MTWGNSSNPGYTHHIEAVKHDVGEVQVSDTRPLDSKNHREFRKADPVLLHAKPIVPRVKTDEKGMTDATSLHIEVVSLVVD